MLLDWSYCKPEAEHKIDQNLPDKSSIRNLVVVIPGLVGSSDEFYCRTVVEACQKSGKNCVIINHHGGVC